ncbi:unnamed protein product, partial [Durusdinium trenchii]
ELIRDEFKRGKSVESVTSLKDEMMNAALAKLESKVADEAVEPLDAVQDEGMEAEEEENDEEQDDI